VLCKDRERAPQVESLMETSRSHVESKQRCSSCVICRLSSSYKYTCPARSDSSEARCSRGNSRIRIRSSGGILTKPANKRRDPIRHDSDPRGIEFRLYQSSVPFLRGRMSNDVVRSPGIIASRSSFIGHWSLLKNRPLGSAAAWIWLIKLDPKVELSLMVCKLPL